MTPSPTRVSDHDLELLSAYLDGALTDRERQALEHRLADDPALRAALDDLRGTVALLRTLPPLRAPRSFALDPAIYGRRIGWWRRLATTGFVLQAAGALGAVASVAILALALLIAQNTLDGGTARDQTQPALVAHDQAGTPSTAQVAMATEEAIVAQTSIAYAGEGLFQATIAMQNEYYAALPTPSAAIASPVAEGEALTTAEEAQVPVPAAGEPALPQAEAAALGAAGAAEAPAVPFADQPSGIAAEADAGVAAPAPALAPPPSTPTTAGALKAEASAPPSATPGASAADQAALREVAEDQARTPSPSASPYATATTGVVAAAPTQVPAETLAGREAEPAPDRAGPGDADRSTRLAALGVVTLVLSATLIALGRWKARRT